MSSTSHKNACILFSPRTESARTRCAAIVYDDRLKDTPDRGVCEKPHCRDAASSRRSKYFTNILNKCLTRRSVQV